MRANSECGYILICVYNCLKIILYSKWNTYEVPEYYLYYKRF